MDDSPSDLLLCESYLTIKGFEVTTTTEGRAAIELLKDSFFDIAVLDYQMPGTNGLELARQIRKIRGDMPIILYSGALPAEARDCSWIEHALDKSEGSAALISAILNLLKRQ